MMLICLGGVTYNYGQEAPLKKVDSKHFKNLYRVNDNLYRSEQPSKKGFKEIELMGVTTILNLRRLRNNTKKAKDFNFILVHNRALFMLTEMDFQIFNPMERTIVFL